MKIANLFTLLCLLFVVTTASAQTPPLITVTSEDSIWINKLLLTSAVNEAQLIKELGKPSRRVEKATETSFYYDDLGLVVVLSEGKFSAIGVNFNWDGDKKFPEKSYTGKLLIGKTEITRTSTKEDLEKNNVVKIACPIPAICASSSKTANVKALAGFANSAVTQVTFLLK